MANVEAAETRLSFDDILEAVQDSGRGRWFLQEFENRLQKRDNQSILQAISRLENRMESLAPHASNPDDLAKVRAAMAKARSDLINLGLGKDGLSNEGRLFADLAELAKKAMPVAIDSNEGIVRTLQLVDEIDRTISPREDRGAKYFAADSNLFERSTAHPKPALIAVPDVPREKLPEATVEPQVSVATKPDVAPTGAKLVIRKTSEVIEPVTPQVETPRVEHQKEVAPISEQPLQIIPPRDDLPAIDNPRIVIIRRRAEDMPEVALSENAESVSAA
jgi:hypothetical protein